MKSNLGLSIALAWRQTLSLWRAGALHVLSVALVLAVAAITAVGFFTQRVDSGLNQQGGLLLGGDLAVMADHPIASLFSQHAAKQQLKQVNTYEFASMILFGENSQLAEIKAVDMRFPLRGELTIGASISEAGRNVQHGPALGEVWLEPRLINLLGVQQGDYLQVGEARLKVSAVLLKEPSRGGDMFGFAPRLMMNAQDLPATQLIQLGSRVKYQLLLASDAPRRIQAFADTVKPQLKAGERLEDVRSARPEMKLALDKARQFLNISAMVSVILAMVAMLLSSLPYIKQSLDSFALMRCFGAQQNTVLQVLAIQTLIIALLSALVGVGLGYIAQFGLAQLAGSLFLTSLPSVSAAPMWVGVMASLSMMLAVVLPHAWQMRHLSANNILRRETLAQPLSALAKYLPAALVLGAMVLWQAHDAKLGLATIAALVLLSVLVAAMTLLCVKLTQPLLSFAIKIAPQHTWVSAARIGLQALQSRLALSTVQIVGFSMGLMVLILLALIRGDLIQNWQASLPADAPNRFVINIQAEQVASLKAFFGQQHIEDAHVFPMVRGRLVRINQREVSAESWQSERAKRLATREFNLSWAAQMQSDNQLVGGRWWATADDGKPYISLEQDLAKTLNIQLGDQLTFEIAGSPLVLTVTSLRKVEWGSMRANFFALTPPNVLNQYAASYISSFHLPLGADAALNQLIKTYPNFTVIDIAALMQQVRGIMQKMSSTIEYVFMFSLVTGVAVLYAALVATRQERIVEATLLRVFGASKRQVNTAYLAEFACMGFIAAFVATLFAHLLAYYLSVEVLQIPYQWNMRASLYALIGATWCIPLVAWFGLRAHLNVPPRQLLNSI